MSRAEISGTYFIYFEFVSSMVGGQPRRTQNVYLNNQGTVQLSRLVSSGEIRELIEKKEMDTLWAEAVSLLESAPQRVQKKKRTPGMLQEYYPQQVTVISFLPDRRYTVFSRTGEQRYADFKERVHERIEGLSSGCHRRDDTALYLQARQINLDSAFVQFDLEAETLGDIEDQWLRQALQHQMRLVKVKEVLTQKEVNLKKGDNIYVLAGECPFVIHVYELEK